MAFPPSLSINRLSVWLSGRPILDRISLTLDRGQRIALLGSSGSGKSMTARAALGLLPPQAEIAGRMEVDGIDVTCAPALSRPAAARPAMVMQDTQAALNPLATIGHQLEQPLRRTGLGPADARLASHDLLEQVGLPDPAQIARRCSPELSGGQRQRVCIAMAVALRPRILIADEPTTALDVTTQAQILDLIKDLVDDEGMACLLITHDLAVVAGLADHVAVMRQGEIVEAGATEALFRTRAHA
ncbi:MAG: ABC transporter ATP-binding protein, partial [Pseudomonadota bacterium]